MASRLRCFARSILSVLVLTLMISVSSQGPAASPAHDALRSDGAEARNRSTEVRLRKLHLVRPDLIPYPIALEVYC